MLCIISKILKSEIEGEGIPDKGTPQGGLISPLLSLIVLNELDWWVSSQWETFTPNGVKKGNMKGSKGWLSYARKYTNLKMGMWCVTLMILKLCAEVILMHKDIIMRQ